MSLTSTPLDFTKAIISFTFFVLSFCKLAMSLPPSVITLKVKLATSGMAVIFPSPLTEKLRKAEGSIELA